jgi:hypothetical protein
MNYQILRTNDSKSFALLENTPPSDEPKVMQLFGMAACIYFYDSLPGFPSDLTILIPNIPTYPVEYGFVLTRGGERMFCYVVTKKVAGHREAYFFEVSPILLLLTAYGLRTRDGRSFSMPPLLDVIAPDDGIPINFLHISPESETYCQLREGVPDTAPWVPSPAAQQKNISNTTTSPANELQPKVTPIYFELGAPCFHAMRINGDPGLIAMSRIGGPNE